MDSVFFTEDDRRQLLGRLTGWAHAQPLLLGTVLVGSGAYGFRDRYSDLDLLYVADSAAVPAVVSWASAQTAGQLVPCFATSYQHRDDVYVLCFLLDNGLEVNLGIWSAESLFAARPAWLILHSRDQASREIIEASLRGHAEPPGPTGPASAATIRCGSSPSGGRSPGCATMRRRPASSGANSPRT